MFSHLLTTLQWSPDANGILPCCNEVCTYLFEDYCRLHWWQLPIGKTVLPRRREYYCFTIIRSLHSICKILYLTALRFTDTLQTFYCLFFSTLFMFYQCNFHNNFLTSTLLYIDLSIFLNIKWHERKNYSENIISLLCFSQ